MVARFPTVIALRNCEYKSATAECGCGIRIVVFDITGTSINCIQIFDVDLFLQKRHFEIQSWSCDAIERSEATAACLVCSIKKQEDASPARTTRTKALPIHGSASKASTPTFWQVAADSRQRFEDITGGGSAYAPAAPPENSFFCNLPHVRSKVSRARSSNSTK
jgi:hypothetical protein